MKENPFGNMGTDTLYLSPGSEPKPQVSMGAVDAAIEECWSCVALHVNACRAGGLGTGRQEAGHGPSRMAGGSLTNRVLLKEDCLGSQKQSISANPFPLGAESTCENQ